MVNHDICPKCNHKSFYYRIAFGSWRCAKCGYEKENKDKTGTGERIEADEWWNYLSANNKIKIYRKAKETLNSDTRETKELSHNSIEGETKL